MDFFTDNFKCRLLNPKDVDFYCSLYTNQEIMEKIAPPLSLSQAKDKFSTTLSDMQKVPCNKLFWIIEEQETGRFVGAQGLTWQNSTIRDEAEIGLILIPGAQKRRHSIELLKGLIDYGFEHLELKRIYAHYIPDNIAAERLVKALDFYIQPELKEMSVLQGLAPNLVKYCYIDKKD